MIKKTFSVFILLGTIAIIFMRCNGATADISKKIKDPLISDSTMLLLKFDTVLLKNIDDQVKLSGVVSFDENKVVKVYPFSSGHVLSANVSVGDFVKAGQILATIKSADIAGNYSDLSVAGNDVAITKRNMQNTEHLYNNGISSEREYEEAKQTFNKALANANKLKEQIQINGGGKTSANGIYSVSAPRSGYVVEKLINPGNFIRNDNNNNLFTIGDVSDVWIWANVFETDIAKVKEGYIASVTTVAYPDSVFVGKVDKVNKVLDPVTKVMKVKIVLANKSGVLKPEMFANVLISNSQSKQLPAVPSSAIINENGKNYVLVFNNKDDVKVHEITTLKTVGDKTFITAGLEPGQKIITQNQILVFRKLTDK